MDKILNKFLRDESGALTVEMAVLIASAVVLSIAALVVMAPGFGAATGYSVNLLNFDREGNENPECRYVEGYQDSPLYMDDQGNIITTCTDLYNLQQQGVDIQNPDGAEPAAVVTSG